MNKTIKKLISVAMVGTMAVSMIACGSSSSGSSSSAPAASNSGSAEVEVPSETRTIKIGTWYDHYYDSTHEDIYANPSMDDEEEAQKMFDNTKAVEEKYNCKIEFVNLTWDGVQESINTSILAGTPDCDVYECDLSFGVPAALNGFAMNVSDVIDANDDLLTNQDIFMQVDCGKSDGVYLFKSHTASAPLEGTYMLAYNKQMLDEAGLEDPNALYEKGEWTWDKWREYMLALTQDTNGDGVTDVYGFGTRYDFLVYLMTMSNGTEIAPGATENLSSPEVGEALDFIYNMYNVDHCANPWNADDWDYNQNCYMDGKVAMWITAAWISSANSDATLGFDIVWCPWPVGPHGNKDTNKLKNDSSGNAWMIPTGVEDPTYVYNVFRDWQNWFGGDTSVRDANLTWWEDCAITEENYHVMEYYGSAGRGAFDLWNSLGVEWDYPGLLDGTYTTAQFQETFKQPLQDALDGYFK